MQLLWILHLFAVAALGPVAITNETTVTSTISDSVTVTQSDLTSATRTASAGLTLSPTETASRPVTNTLSGSFNTSTTLSQTVYEAESKSKTQQQTTTRTLGTSFSLTAAPSLSETTSASWTPSDSLTAHSTSVTLSPTITHSLSLTPSTSPTIPGVPFVELHFQLSVGEHCEPGLILYPRTIVQDGPGAQCHLISDPLGFVDAVVAANCAPLQVVPLSALPSSGSVAFSAKLRDYIGQESVATKVVETADTGAVVFDSVILSGMTGNVLELALTPFLRGCQNVSDPWDRISPATIAVDWTLDPRVATNFFTTPAGNGALDGEAEGGTYYLKANISRHGAPLAIFGFVVTLIDAPLGVVLSPAYYHTHPTSLPLLIYGRVLGGFASRGNATSFRWHVCLLPAGETEPGACLTTNVAAPVVRDVLSSRISVAAGDIPPGRYLFRLTARHQRGVGTASVIVDVVAGPAVLIELHWYRLIGLDVVYANVTKSSAMTGTPTYAWRASTSFGGTLNLSLSEIAPYGFRGQGLQLRWDQPGNVTVALTAQLGGTKSVAQLVLDNARPYGGSFQVGSALADVSLRQFEPLQIWADGWKDPESSAAVLVMPWYLDGETNLLVPLAELAPGADILTFAPYQPTGPTHFVLDLVGTGGHLRETVQLRTSKSDTLPTKIRTQGTMMQLVSTVALATAWAQETGSVPAGIVGDLRAAITTARFEDLHVGLLPGYAWALQALSDMAVSHSLFAPEELLSFAWLLLRNGNTTGLAFALEPAEHCGAVWKTMVRSVREILRRQYPSTARRLLATQQPLALNGEASQQLATGIDSLADLLAVGLLPGQSRCAELSGYSLNDSLCVFHLFEKATALVSNGLRIDLPASYWQTTGSSTSQTLLVRVAIFNAAMPSGVPLVSFGAVPYLGSFATAGNAGQWPANSRAVVAFADVDESFECFSNRLWQQSWEEASTNAKNRTITCSTRFLSDVLTIAPVQVPAPSPVPVPPTPAAPVPAVEPAGSPTSVDEGAYFQKPKDSGGSFCMWCFLIALWVVYIAALAIYFVADHAWTLFARSIYHVSDVPPRQYSFWAFVTRYHYALAVLPPFPSLPAPHVVTVIFLLFLASLASPVILGDGPSGYKHAVEFGFFSLVITVPLTSAVSFVFFIASGYRKKSPTKYVVVPTTLAQLQEEDFKEVVITGEDRTKEQDSPVMPPVPEARDCPEPEENEIEQDLAKSQPFEYFQDIVEEVLSGKLICALQMVCQRQKVDVNEALQRASAMSRIPENMLSVQLEQEEANAPSWLVGISHLRAGNVETALVTFAYNLVAFSFRTAEVIPESCVPWAVYYADILGLQETADYLRQSRPAPIPESGSFNLVAADVQRVRTRAVPDMDEIKWAWRQGIVACRGKQFLLAAGIFTDVKNRLIPPGQPLKALEFGQRWAQHYAERLGIGFVDFTTSWNGQAQATLDEFASYATPRSQQGNPEFQQQQQQQQSFFDDDVVLAGPPEPRRTPEHSVDFENIPGLVAQQLPEVVPAPVREPILPIDRPLPLAASEQVVHPGLSTKKITAIIASCSAGRPVVFESGSYPSFTLRHPPKNVTLRAADGAAVLLGSEEYPYSLSIYSAQGIRIEGFTFVGKAGVFLCRCTNVSMSSNEFDVDGRLLRSKDSVGVDCTLWNNMVHNSLPQYRPVLDLAGFAIALCAMVYLTVHIIFRVDRVETGPIFVSAAISLGSSLLVVEPLKLVLVYTCLKATR